MSPIHLLLVEDNLDQQMLVKRAFRRHNSSIELTIAGDGDQCLTAAPTRQFSAILLDYSLPRMTGLQVLGRLREQGCQAPVIMVTGQGDETIAVEAMKAGAYDYVVKSEHYLAALPTLVEKVIERHAMKGRLERFQQRLQQLQAISVELTRELRLTALAQVMVDGACALTDSACGLAIFSHQGRNEVELWATHGLDLEGAGLQGSLKELGLFSQAFHAEGVVLVNQPGEAPLPEGTPPHHPRIGRGAALAIRRGKDVIGLLYVGNPRGDREYDQEDQQLLATLASHVVTAAENVRFVEEAQRQASTDYLTGLFNHREFQRRLEDELSRSQRYGHECSLILLDIDHFKSFNDTYGHQVGDDVLRLLGQSVRGSIRQGIDVPARYGGEEFTIILPETDAKGGLMVAERVRKRIADSGVEVQGGVKAPLTISVGVATFPADATTRPLLIQAADQALYFAKEAGRNQACAYHQTLKATIEKDHDKVAELLLSNDLKMVNDLAMAIDAKSPYLRGHSEAVAKMATAFAERLDVGSTQKESLMIASLLHNIGTIAIPDHILNKVGPLTDEERRIVHAHPAVAEALLTKVPYLEQVIPAIICHHERYDGTGYPKGLKGEEIPLLARVLTVVVAYHAMRSVRPYRRRLTHEEAVAELKKYAGKQFDPKIVDRFVEFASAVTL
ncbi:MAG: diguanylate cyclase [Nitrospirae bacterium]|nr:diguanylate cyclase [Nitrospirota bacterium]